MTIRDISFSSSAEITPASASRLANHSEVTGDIAALLSLSEGVHRHGEVDLRPVADAYLVRAQRPPGDPRAHRRTGQRLVGDQARAGGGEDRERRVPRGRRVALIARQHREAAADR